MLSTYNVGVYLDSNTCLYHFDNLKYHDCNFQNYFIESANLNQFISSQLSIKFAAFHVPFVRDTAWLDRLNQTLTVSNQVFIFCSELHQHTVEQLINLDIPNITIFACGFINHNWQHAKVYTWMDWFITTNYFYKDIRPGLLNEKLTTNSKSKYFDILLGCRRPHRDFIYQYINDTNLSSNMIMTYYQRWNVDLRNTDHIFELEGLEFLPESNYTHSVSQVSYYGYKMNLSQVVPFIIYNDSYYSVVAETNASNDFNFYTEKIVKPILAKRLFIVVAGQGYLKNLRSFGFKTFDSIIDESYDLESDDYLRWTKAMDQVKYLTTQNPIEITDKIKDIVEYNQRIMLTTHWYQNFILQLSDTIVRTIAD